MITGFLIGFLGSRTYRFSVKLEKQAIEIMDLKGRIKELDRNNDFNDSIIRNFRDKEIYGYWDEYVDMRERVDSLRTVVWKLKSMD